MKVLMLTWEFPPFIAGGLGMACYGLVKALLSSGVKVDLVLPTGDDVYFPMRQVSDVDIMPVDYLDPSRKNLFTVQTHENLLERLKAVGVSATPESYFTPGIDYNKFYELFTKSQFSLKDASVDKINLYLNGDTPLFRKVQELLARMVKFAPFLNCDVIHAHDWLTYPAGVALKNILRKPLISHIHATEFDRAGGVGDERIHNIEYAGLEAADRVIAVSNYTAQMVIDRYRIQPHKIEVVHNAYSVSPAVNEKRKKLFKDPLVLFLGRVTLQKGPDYYVEVADRVLKRYPNVRFVMAGSGDMFSKVLRRSANRRLKDRFLLAGFLNRKQVEDILSTTDIFVLPSVSEPFGIVPLEAMAFGAVAIVSKQSGVSEVIDNVFKVDFWDVEKMADIIIDLLENPEKRNQYSKMGQEEVLGIGWQSAAQRTRELYERI